MASTTHIPEPTGIPVSRFTTWFHATRERAARYRAYRRTLRELSALNTRQLSDLGLHRSSISKVAYLAAYEGK